jgi:hypothetical protein
LSAAFRKTWNRPEWHPLVSMTVKDDGENIVVTFTAPPPNVDGE